MVKSPGTLVISAYATCPDITKIVTPDIKRPGKSKILFIDLGNCKDRLGGSALAQCFGQVGDESPDMEDSALLKNAFHAVQTLIDKGLILSGHDRSDGGLVTTLLEMAFSGNCGMEINVRSQKSEVRSQNEEIISKLFSEELGMAIEYMPESEGEIFNILGSLSVPYEVIGKTVEEKRIKISLASSGPLTLDPAPFITILDADMTALLAVWEETSYRLELLQANPECVNQERETSIARTGPSYHISFTPEETPAEVLRRETKPAVAVIREEGSNGDREMTSAFHLAGFEAWDVTMTDLLEGKVSLSGFRGVVFVGGFSYADVMDSAKGWAGTIRFNKGLFDQFQEFYNRPDTFSLGVCNGCQLMALLGWVPWQGISNEIQPRFIHNKSGRFESRFSTVKVLTSPAIMLQGMEGSVLGVWVAHGEGLAHFPDNTTMQEVLEKNLAPLRYVDDAGAFTETYPFNPNGSPEGITALCSPDGRHLAMMPHPERAILPWQWAWMPEDMKEGMKASPWLRMFQNARKWCEG
ncbi:MAG: phosphoribosylformylglycinamidine synthase, partial [Nitrospirales bacterium]|nr:phosphoribosylformylglycinamidine synthase [Nitrospirales bacterium]